MMHGPIAQARGFQQRYISLHCPGSEPRGTASSPPRGAATVQGSHHTDARGQGTRGAPYTPVPPMGQVGSQVELKLDGLLVGMKTQFHAPAVLLKLLQNEDKG